jgi:peptide/nickel transport system ATP-binding protein/oligopeptide transport system ATP-binding protein
MSEIDQTSPAHRLLDVRDLCVTFSTARGQLRAVDGVDLALDKGEILGIVGESGSGKSVTLRAMTRLLRSNATVTGSVKWLGDDLLTMPAHKLRDIRGGQIAMIFQEPMSALNPVLTIGQQIEESLIAHSDRDRQARRARSLQLLDLVGIASGAQRLDSYPHEFSGGMRQRAMIAIALAAEPRLLLADEPTTALDVTIQDQILKLLVQLTEDLGMAMVLVTHDLGVVAETCDRVAVMYTGRVMETGPVADVFQSPRHAYTAALLQSMPKGGTARDPLIPIPGMPPRLDRPIPGCAFAPRCGLTEPICRSTRPAMAMQSARHAAACWASDRLAAKETAA